MINQQRASPCHTSLFPLECSMCYQQSEYSTHEMIETTWALPSGSLTFDSARKCKFLRFAILQKTIIGFLAKKQKRWICSQLYDEKTFITRTAFNRIETNEVVECNWLSKWVCRNYDITLLFINLIHQFTKNVWRHINFHIHKKFSFTSYFLFFCFTWIIVSVLIYDIVDLKAKWHNLENINVNYTKVSRNGVFMSEGNKRLGHAQQIMLKIKRIFQA